MGITAKFQEKFHDYRNYDERMGNKLKFVYNVDRCDVVVYSEELDCYDGYDHLGTPYYWDFTDKWEDITLLEFAQLIEYYLEYKKSFDDEGIFCIFKIL